MAQRKPAAAPAKQKLRKNHGPKRHTFHCWSSTLRWRFSQDGLLTKYDNKESFILSLNARGVKQDADELWAKFKVLPTKEAKDDFLRNLKRKA